LWQTRDIAAGYSRYVSITNKDEIINQVEKRQKVTRNFQDTRRVIERRNFDGIVNFDAGLARAVLQACGFIPVGSCQISMPGECGLIAVL